MLTIFVCVVIICNNVDWDPTIGAYVWGLQSGITDLGSGDALTCTGVPWEAYGEGLQSGVTNLGSGMQSPAGAYSGGPTARAYSPESPIWEPGTHSLTCRGVQWVRTVGTTSLRSGDTFNVTVV